MPSEHEGPTKPRRGGRQRIGAKPTLVRFPDGVPERIDAIAGKNRRAEFIREVVVSELERREAQTAATASNDKPPAGAKQPEGE